MLITFYNQVFTALQKSLGNEVCFEVILDKIWAQIKPVSHSANYLSKKHVLKDEILLVGIYLCAHPFKKLMKVTWDLILL